MIYTVNKYFVHCICFIKYEFYIDSKLGCNARLPPLFPKKKKKYLALDDL